MAMLWQRKEIPASYVRILVSKAPIAPNSEAWSATATNVYLPIVADSVQPRPASAWLRRVGSRMRSPLGQLSQTARTMVRIASLCLAVYWLAIFVATHLPKQAMPSLNWSDKVYHALAFSGLAFLLAWAIPKHGRNWSRHLTLVAIIAISYAGLDEFTQRFIPGRTCDIWDVAADALGTGIGLACYLALRAVLTQVSWGRQLIRKLAH